MNKFKVGDKVNIHDGSWIFGIQNGEFNEHCDYSNGSRNNLTVAKTGLFVMLYKDYEDAEPNDTFGISSAINDLLVTDGNGNFWFTQSRFCNPVEPNHSIVIDNKTIILSHKSFLELKRQLV